MKKFTIFERKQQSNVRLGTIIANNVPEALLKSFNKFNIKNNNRQKNIFIKSKK